MFLIYAVVARGVSDPRVAPALLTGMAGAIFLQAALAIWERFALGQLQVSGGLGHQNTLGLMSHFVVLPFFSLLLVRSRGWMPPAVLVAGLIVEVLTGSRATVGLAGIAHAVIFAGSAIRQWSLRKAKVLLIGAVVFAVAAPVALVSFAQRGEANLESSNEERVALESAAASMLADHPWGVGANHFAFVANLSGYYQRAGVSWNSFGCASSQRLLVGRRRDWLSRLNCPVFSAAASGCCRARLQLALSWLMTGETSYLASVSRCSPFTLILLSNGYSLRLSLNTCWLLT